jgi:hypothetical protein
MIVPTIATVDLGDPVNLRAAITDLTTAPAEPFVAATVAAVAIRGSERIEFTFEPVAGQAGTYTARFEPTASGNWLIKVTPSGARTGVEWGAVRVRPAPAA